jgi:hypothetical protein
MKCLTCTKWRPCLSMGRFRETLASFDGMTLNSAAIGRRLALSRTTAMTWIRAYERAGLLRLLPFYGESRRPLLLLQPGYGEAGSDFGRKELIEVLRRLLPDCRFFWWKARSVRAVHLVADLSKERVGFCISTSPVPRRQDWLPLTIALKRGVIHRGFLLHAADGAFFKDKAIIALPLGAFLLEPKEWLFHRRSVVSARDAVWRINRERLAAWAAHR